MEEVAQKERERERERNKEKKSGRQINLTQILSAIVGRGHTFNSFYETSINLILWVIDKDIIKI